MSVMKHVRAHLHEIDLVSCLGGELAEAACEGHTNALTRRRFAHEGSRYVCCLVSSRVVFNSNSDICVVLVVQTVEKAKKQHVKAAQLVCSFVSVCALFDCHNLPSLTPAHFFMCNIVFP